MTTPGTSRVPDVTPRALALATLDARSFAQLLRALRAMAEVPEDLAVTLSRPTSELANGSTRVELCRQLSAADPVMTVLRADDSLPAAVHVAIGPTVGGTADAVDDAPQPPVARASERGAERVRELRRTLEEERRRREGAEARAVAADARAADAESVRSGLEARLIALEGELADAADAVRQASDRVERRAGTRIAALEQDLATERSALAALRRDHERSRAELAVARIELARLQGALDRAPAPVVEAPDGRPLVLPPELDPDTTEAASWLAQQARLLLVDGYNVSLALRGGHPLDEQRRWLIDRLRPLVVRGSSGAVVIFDGDGATGSRRDAAGVEVRFTAAGTTADDEIVFAVAATADPVLVITDDVELRQRVQVEGGNVIGTVHLLGAIDG